MGTIYMEGPDGQTASFPNQGFINWAIASDELLGLLDSWGVHPVVSRKYPVPVDVVAGSTDMIRGSRHSSDSAEGA